MAARALILSLCAALAPLGGGVAYGVVGTDVTGVRYASTFTPELAPATAAATAAQLAATQAAAKATTQVAGPVTNAYVNMARKAERAYTKKQDAVMGLLYVDVSANLGDPLAVCNDGSQGELPGRRCASLGTQQLRAASRHLPTTHSGHKKTAVS